MIELTTKLCFLLLTASIGLGLYRLGRGPGVLDRVMAFDLITTCVVGMIALLCILWRTTVYLEVILIISLLGFLTAVGFVLYLQRTVRSHSGKAYDPGRNRTVEHE